MKFNIFYFYGIYHNFLMSIAIGFSIKKSLKIQNYVQIPEHDHTISLHQIPLLPVTAKSIKNYGVTQPGTIFFHYTSAIPLFPVTVRYDDIQTKS